MNFIQFCNQPHTLFEKQHELFLRGIQPSTPSFDCMSPPEKIATVTTEVQDCDDIVTAWQDFIEGDSELDLLNGLNQAFKETNQKKDSLIQIQEQMNANQRSQTTVQHVKKIRKAKLSGISQRNFQKLIPQFKLKQLNQKQQKPSNHTTTSSQVKQNGADKQSTIRSNVKSFLVKYKQQQNISSKVNSKQAENQASKSNSQNVQSSDEKYCSQSTECQSNSQSQVYRTSDQTYISTNQDQARNLSRKRQNIKAVHSQLSSRLGQQNTTLANMVQTAQQKNFSTIIDHQQSFSMRNYSQTRSQKEEGQNDLSHLGKIYDQIRSHTSQTIASQDKLNVSIKHLQDLIIKVSIEQKTLINQVKDQIQMNQLSKRQVDVSPNFRSQKAIYEDKLQKSFKSPHQLLKLNQKLKRILDGQQEIIKSHLSSRQTKISSIEESTIQDMRQMTIAKVNKEQERLRQPKINDAVKQNVRRDLSNLGFRKRQEIYNQCTTQMQIQN
ncbi:UNKNOWN [Stylonychia lemnae]|uniref:Uncharacterized protein n=1 Tax=Stylonychia lemnae TaxID=5949 RepID=A0A078AMC4_STYLE|nr:UNKNOWN [Stylonychia lemnae]|eukprot:CDW81998.1 UNKNOWN [Stylonychia lemnae]